MLPATLAASLAQTGNQNKPTPLIFKRKSQQRMPYANLAANPRTLRKSTMNWCVSWIPSATAYSLNAMKKAHGFYHRYASCTTQNDSLRNSICGSIGVSGLHCCERKKLRIVNSELLYVSFQISVLQQDFTQVLRAVLFCVFNCLF